MWDMYLDLMFIYKSSLPRKDFGKGFKPNCLKRITPGIKSRASWKELGSNQNCLQQQLDNTAKLGPMCLENEWKLVLFFLSSDETILCHQIQRKVTQISVPQFCTVKDLENFVHLICVRANWSSYSSSRKLGMLSFASWPWRM